AVRRVLPVGDDGSRGRSRGPEPGPAPRPSGRLGGVLRLPLRSCDGGRAAALPDADDVVLTNRHGQVTETTIANLCVRLDGRWWTPPVTAGCLPGVERGRLVAAGVLHERPLTPA